MNEIEEWRWVKDYVGMYQVSNLGNLRSHVISKCTKQLRPHTGKQGYVRAIFTVKRRPKTFLLHRLVAQAFVPNPNNLPEVNHINGVKSDNRASNIEWVTRQQNAQHAWNLGLITPAQEKGEKHWNSKFTDSQVVALRARYARGGVSHNQLAREFGVTKTCIGLILRRKSWTHLH